MQIMIFAIIGLGTSLVLFVLGAFYLMRKKIVLVIMLLKERCAEEGVAFGMEPVEGRFASADASALRRGVLCVTAYELIFIPLRGRTPEKILLSDIKTCGKANENTVHIETSGGAAIVAVSDPDAWVKALSGS